MKHSLKYLSLLTVFFLIFSMASCRKKTSKTSANENKEHTSEVDDKETENKDGENAQKSYEEKGAQAADESVKSDEEAASEAFTAYVDAAKKLDSAEMSKYISDNSKVDILDSYRSAYSKYSVSDSRIKELCRARLESYKITPVSSKKTDGGVTITAKIETVNMESLQNKWLETLDDKYPEYTSLSDDEMTPEVVDVLIQTMIDVLRSAETSVELQKDFSMVKKDGAWMIDGKNSDVFPSN